MKKLVYDTTRLVYSLVYLIIKVFVREDKRVSIVSTHGAKYFIGNSKYYFDYAYHRNPKHTFIASKRKDTIADICEKYNPQNVLYTYSLRYLIQLAKASKLFLISGEADFAPIYLRFVKEKVIINLFHGIALKNMSSPEGTKFYNSCLTAYIVASEIEQKAISKSFDLPLDKVWITGLPKNDVLIDDHNKLTEEKIILYAPTFRDKGEKIRLFPFENFDFPALNTILTRYNAKIVLRLHINSIEKGDIQNFSKYDRIVFSNAMKETDTQLILKQTSILITDYSGIFFDFLLLNRPVVFIPYDFDEYQKSRDFQFPYFESTPGPKIKSGEEFLSTIEQMLADPDFGKEERTVLKNRFHKYDSNFSERIYNRVFSDGEE